MDKLNNRYIFDFQRILLEDKYHIEYSITDICNKNCTACSHLAPLAKDPNFVTDEEFTHNIKILRNCIPEPHTVWLTGGEPTLHPNFIQLLSITRKIYSDTYVGIYSNGITLKSYETNKKFWDFVKDNGIVWAITPYDSDMHYFEDLFDSYGCLNNLAEVQSGKYFFNLTNYSHNQPISFEKYKKCGWEKSKINVRNGKIYNCPSVEFADLFNSYFGAGLKIKESDCLVIDESLTRERIEKFRGPVPFCGQCDLNRRYKKLFPNSTSERCIEEWSDFK